jgi:hypothetical protein
LGISFTAPSNAVGTLDAYIAVVIGRLAKQAEQFTSSGMPRDLAVLEHRAQKWTRFCGNTMRQNKVSCAKADPVLRPTPHDKKARASDDDDQSSDALWLGSASCSEKREEVCTSSAPLQSARPPYFALLEGF